MTRIAETLCIDLVEILGAGGTCREPAMIGRDFESDDPRVVTRRASQLCGNGFAGKRGGVHGVGRELPETRLLLRRRRCIDTRVARSAELFRDLAVVLAWILTGSRFDLGSEQGEDQPILVGGP